MSILDTFYILFKTDAEEAAKDIKEVDKASDDAAASLQKADAAASKFRTTIADAGAKMAAAAIAIGAAAATAMVHFTTERAAAIRELDQFSSKLNSSISDVDAFTRVVKGMGGETAAALDSLVKIGEKVNEAFSDKESGAREDFKAWGLAFQDTKGQALGASEAMLRLAANLEGVSRAEALARIKKLGIEDAGTIDLLLKGRRAVEEKMEAEKKFGVVTERQAEVTRQYYEQLGKAQNLMTSIGNRVLEAVLPAVTKTIAALSRFVGWMVEHETLVKGFFIGVAGVITAVYLPAIYSAAAATIAATWPFLAIGAAIAAVGAAFALAYEDVVAFMNGQPSLIGELAKKYEWFGDLIKSIGPAFTLLKEFATRSLAAIVDAWDALSKGADAAWAFLEPILTGIGEGAVDLARAYQDFWATLKPIWDAFGNAVQLAGEIWDRVAERLGASAGEAATKFRERFDDIRKAGAAVFSGMWDDIQPIIDLIKQAASLIKDAFIAAFDAIAAVWRGTIGAIADSINDVIDSARRGLGLGDQAGITEKQAAEAGEAMGALAGKKLEPGAATPKTAAPPVGPQTQDQRPLRERVAAAITGFVRTGGAVGNTPPAAANDRAVQLMTEAQKTLAAARAQPLNNQTPATINENKTVNNKSEVNVGGVVINAQTVDAKSVAGAVKGELQKQLRETSSHFDDGVDR